MYYHKKAGVKDLKSGFYSFLKEGLLTILLVTCILTLTNTTSAANELNGETLFKNHCSGCHINGGNIIRRQKTLKLSALQRNGLDDPEKIARVARIGTGIMSGYEEVLGNGGDKLVANWVWQQAQNAWTQG